jgi:hypothetical protein
VYLSQPLYASGEGAAGVGVRIGVGGGVSVGRSVGVTRARPGVSVDLGAGTVVAGREVSVGLIVGAPLESHAASSSATGIKTVIHRIKLRRWIARVGILVLVVMCVSPVSHPAHCQQRQAPITDFAQQTMSSSLVGLLVHVFLS